MEGSRRFLLERKHQDSSYFGGGFTIFAYCCLLLAIVYRILSYYSLSNVTVTSTLGFLKDSTRLKFQQLPWLTTAGGAGAPASSVAASLASASTDTFGSASTPTLPSFNGLLVRVLAMGEPGLCNAPLTFSSSGISSISLGSAVNGSSADVLLLGGTSFFTTAGSMSSKRQWTLKLPNTLSPQQQASLSGKSVFLAPSTCMGTNFSAFTFACDSCELQDTSSLTFLMHYSCQAQVLEVLSAGPGDSAMSGEEMLSFTSPTAALYRMSAALADSAGNSTHFLSGVSLNIRMMRGVVYDTRAMNSFTKRIPGLPLFFTTAPIKPVTGRGYILYGGTSEGVFVNATKYLDRNSSLFFTPNMRAVTVKVTFSSSEIYSITTLSLTISLVALVDSINALSGPFSSFFPPLYALLVLLAIRFFPSLVKKTSDLGGFTAGGNSQTVEGGAGRLSSRSVGVEELECSSSSSSYEESAVGHSGEGSKLAEPGTTAAVEAALQLPSEPAGAMAAAAATAAAAASPPTPPTGPHRTSRFQPLPPPDAWGEAPPPSQTLKQQWGQQQAQQYVQQQAALQAEQHSQLLTQLQLQEAQAAQQALQAEMQAQAIASRVVRNPLLSVRDPLAAALPEPPSPPSAPSSARKTATFYESSQRAVFLGGVTHSPGVGVGLPFTSIPGRTVFGATPSATSSPRAGGSSAVLSSTAPPTLPAASRGLDYYFGQRESTESKNLE